MSDPLEAILRAAQDPAAYAAEEKRRSGSPVVGTLCSYAPEEIIHAAGALPLRLLPGPASAGGAGETHLQVYSCSLARGVLGDLLGGRLPFLDGLVLPHTCDTLQRLSDIWRLNRPGGFHLDVVLPVQVDTEAAREYAVAVLERFRSELGQALGRPIDDRSLRASVETFNRLRAALERLLQLRCRRPEVISGRDMLAVMRAATVMQREALADAVTALADRWEAMPHRPLPAGGGGKRLLLSGGACTAPGLYSAIEDCGARVVWDDLCTGARAVEGRIAPPDGGVAAIAQRYLGRGPCPAKHAGGETRAERLLRSVRDTRAEGVVLVTLKFCDPQAFDLPHLTAALDAGAIPHLHLEIEEGSLVEGRNRTRIEAFIERL
jgi:bcr-type benzoyl-CoA reductase subunit C